MGPAIDIIGPCTIADNRQKLAPRQFKFNGQLRTNQQEAVNDVLRRDFGVLNAATGSGKTTMALAIVAERQQSTLIVVHSEELLYQWCARIRQFLGVEAGLIGDGKYDVQPVTVGIINSVANHLQRKRGLTPIHQFSLKIAG